VGRLAPSALARYDGGPKFVQTDVPEPAGNGGWWFTAGVLRAAVPYGFMIGPNDEFGIHADGWAPLHASIEGWVESVALAYRARMWASSISTVRGEAVDDIDLTRTEPIPEDVALADTWWRGGDTAAIARGEAIVFGRPTFQVATVHAGIAEPEIYLDY
jgi:hypothetical protein